MIGHYQLYKTVSVLLMSEGCICRQSGILQEPSYIEKLQPLFQTVAIAKVQFSIEHNHKSSINKLHFHIKLKNDDYFSVCL